MRHHGDVWKSPEDHRIPERDMTSRAPLLRLPRVEGVTARVLVAFWRREPAAAEHRQRQDHDEQRGDAEGREVRATRDVRRCDRGWADRRGHVRSGGTARAAACTAASAMSAVTSSTATNQTREPTARRNAWAGPTG